MSYFNQYTLIIYILREPFKILFDFNSIDLKRYKKFSMALYILMGWCVVFTGSSAVRAMTAQGFAWMLAGGVAYTVGAVIYGLAGHGAKPKRYMHSVFHLFVLLGSILQYVGIMFYIF